MSDFLVIQGGVTEPRPPRMPRPWCPVEQPVPTEPRGYTATGTPIWLKRSPVTMSGRGKRAKGKFMVPSPSLETVFSDGITFRFSFSQVEGKPWDLDATRQWARDAYTRRTGEPAPDVLSERILVQGNAPGERVAVETIAPADAPRATPKAAKSPAPKPSARPRKPAAAKASPPAPKAEKPTAPWAGKTFFFKSSRTGRLHGIAT